MRPLGIGEILDAALKIYWRNAGTLFRHRGMVVPLVALLASPTIASILSAIHLRIRPVPGKP